MISTVSRTGCGWRRVFGGLHLKGFTDDTAAGYDALTQVFFTWSAFERYADLANDRPPFRALFAYHPRAKVHALAALCRAQDPEHKLSHHAELAAGA